MSFFDRKQDVLDIQLTPYGKWLYGQGKLNPKYYSFTDSDVIYETQHTGFSEIQNDIHDRIVNSLRIKSQHRFTGPQSSSINPDSVQIASLDREYTYGVSLGTSNNDDKLPSWEIRVLKGEISSSATTLTGTLGDINIPQINLNDMYIKTKVIKSDSQGFAPTFDQDPTVDVDECNELDEFEITFSDGTTFETTIEPIFLQIEENNMPLSKENFEIEIFEEVDGNLVPLKFLKDPEKVVNGILLDDDEIEQINFEDLSAEDVDFFFDVDFDAQVDDLREQEEEKTNRFVPDLYDFPRDEFEEC